MLNKVLWKVIVTTVVVGWALLNIIPVNDTPFEKFVLERSTPDFSELLDRASAKVDAGESPTVFLALRDLANSENIDLAQFFPQIRLEDSLVNVQRRNNILMNELLQRSRGRIQLGLDLRGGVAFTLELQERPGQDVSDREREESLAKAIQIISSRVDAFGVAEPVLRPVGLNRIEVQLPGLTTRDNPEITESLKKPARLDFRLVHPTLNPTGLPNEEIPPGYEIMELEIERGRDVFFERLFVKRIPELTGEAVSEAFPTMDEFGNFRVILRFTNEGGNRFANITRAIEEENRQTGVTGRLAIVLDGQLYSAPTVQREIRGGSAEITGRFSQREALDLANVLNNPLDVPLEVVEMNEVGPTLAEDSISSGMRAAIIGACLVVAFMLSYYLAGGLVALLSLACNLTIVIGVLASFGATMTLPGIAALVLTIGMAVDANILIFERIREELRDGKSLQAALTGGFDKVFSTILDANVTTLIASGVMIWLGTGAVKGFGLTLSIGVFATMFSALIISRFLLEALIFGNIVKRMPMFSLLGDRKFDFLKYRKPAFITSWTIVLIGVVFVYIERDTIYGIDFVGGDELTLEFRERLEISAIREVTTGAGLGEVIPLYQAQIGTGLEVLKVQTQFGSGQSVFDAMAAAFPEAGLAILGESQIGPALGKEIQLNALLALVVSLFLILIYVALRFEMGYGVGAVVCTIHDVLITIGIFVLSDRQFTAPMLAAILLVVGYSINDTIVVFDRIREQLDLDKNSSLKDVVNAAISKVLSRSLLTSFTTLLAAVSLFVFAGGVINDIAFTFIIGILVGTFSSIFIASPVFYWWHRGDRRHVEERHDVLPNYEWTAGSKASRPAR